MILFHVLCVSRLIPVIHIIADQQENGEGIAEGNSDDSAAAVGIRSLDDNLHII